MAGLCADANAIVRDMPRTVQDTIMGAINWHRLRCLRAIQWSDDSGDHGLAVEIEEAAPDAVELQNYVQIELAKLGWLHVEVRTEW